MAIDPVCKMDVDERTARFEDTSTRAIHYYFCTPGCKKAFEENPDAYIGE